MWLLKGENVKCERKALLGKGTEWHIVNDLNWVIKLDVLMRKCAGSNDESHEVIKKGLPIESDRNNEVFEVESFSLHFFASPFLNF